jgi:hypothetical protein
MGDKVMVAQPNLGNPFGDPTELTVIGTDVATISETGGYGSYGQSVKLIRGDDGAVREVLFAGSLLKLREAAAAEAIGRYEG